MNWLFRLIEGTDLFSLLLLLAVLSWIGATVIAGCPDLQALSRRIAYFVFIGYVGFRGYTHHPTGAENLLVIVLRGLIAAGYAISICWILLPLLNSFKEWLARHVVIQPLIAHRDVLKPIENQQITSTAPPEQVATIRSDMPTEDAAVIEERRLRDEAENSRRLAERKRREEALLRVELLYERRARELSTVFPRDRFDAFVKKYMNDEVSVEWVEEREKLLQETIADAVGTMNDIKFDSLQSLATYFDQRREEIRAMSVSDDVRDAYEVQLNKQEDAALRKFLRT